MKTESNTLSYKNIVPWLLAVVFFFLFLKGCIGNKPTESTTTKIDTVYTEKVIYTPKIEQVFIKEKPKPEKEIPISVTDTIRTYNNVYNDSTGLVSVIVNDSVNGHLLKQKVKFEVKPQEVKYTEKTITKEVTTKLKPSFILSAGLRTNIGVNPSVGVDLMIKNKSGYNFEAGYNTNKEITIGVKKDLITLFK